MTKDQKREAKIFVKGHSLYWWVSRGVKCPDCSSSDQLLISDQRKSTSTRINSRMIDETFLAQFVCHCGCHFSAEFTEFDVHLKNPSWASGDLWD